MTSLDQVLFSNLLGSLLILCITMLADFKCKFLAEWLSEIQHVLHLTKRFVVLKVQNR